MIEARDREFRLKGGLKLHGVFYAGGACAPAICLPGLARNERDFADFAPWLAATGRDVLALSFRGRGRSDYDPQYLNYHPATYVADVIEALDALGWREALFVGTSLGGIVTMLTNQAAPARVAAAIINDVGPELAVEGLTRIGAMVGAQRPDAKNLDEAADQIRAVNEAMFPGRDRDFWRIFAKRTFRESPDGRWVLDYDQSIGRAIAEVGPGSDLWPAFASLKGKPTLVLRGSTSDLLTPPIIEKMRAVAPNMIAVEVAGVGHAPSLAESDALAAIRAFVAEL